MTVFQETDENALVQAAQQGNAEAFGQLYERYAARLFGFLRASLNDPQDAEDLTVEVFIKAWQALPGYQPRGLPFGAFLFRIARNALTDRYRLRRQTETLLPEDWADATQPDPAISLEARQQRGELARALQALRPEYRTVLALRFLAGLSPEETAAAMGKSNGAVRILQHRALAALRSIMEQPEQVSDEHSQ